MKDQAMTAKRCYNTAEAMTYLGIKRRSFEAHIQPHLAGKGIPIGTSVVYEIRDLDEAWEKYKTIAAGGECPGVMKGVTAWDELKQPAFRKRTPVTTSTKSTKESAFSNVASLILHQQKNG